MPGPNRSQVHIDAALTNLSVAYMQSADMFVADRVFPKVNVQKQSDRYFVYLKEDWFRDEAELRAPATESAGGGYELDNTPTYFCQKYAYHKEVTEEDRVNADNTLNPDKDAVDFVSQKLLLRREVLWSQQYFRPNIWNNEEAGGAAIGVGVDFVQWDLPGSTPIEDITNAIMTIASQTGYRPNKLVLGARVYAALKNHDDILGRIVFTQRGIVTPDILASLLDVDEVLVTWAVQNTAAKGAAEATDFLHGDHALLAYAAQSPALKTPSAGYVFSWTGLMGAGAYANRFLRLPMDHLGLGTERIEGEMAFDLRVVANELAVFFNGAIS